MYELFCMGTTSAERVVVRSVCAGLIMAGVVMMLFFCTVTWVTTDAQETILPSFFSERFIQFMTAAPLTVTGLSCEYSWTSKAVILVWDHLKFVQYQFEVQVNGGSPKIVNETRYRIGDVPSVEYFDVSVTSLDGWRRSRPVSVRCQTKLKGVIVGSAVAAIGILFIIFVLICREVFIKLRSVKRSSTEVMVQTTNQTDFISGSSINIGLQENGYEDLDVKTRVQAPYEICRPPHCFNGPSVQGINISDVVIYESY